MPQTPDDIEGGITDADKVIYRDAGMTADAEGESVYKDGHFQLRDHEGTFDPRSGADDKKVKVTAADTNPDYLNPKLQAGTGISLSVVNPGGDEKVQITCTVTDDKKVKASAADTTPDYLYPKLAAGTGVSLTLINPAGNEQVQISVGSAPFRKNARLQCPIDHQVASNAWAEVGNIFWDYSEYGAATILRWTGMIYRNNANLSIRAVLESTGEQLGIVTVTTGNYQSATFNLTGLPAADDAVSLQIKRNSGTGGEIVAGQFEFLES